MAAIEAEVRTGAPIESRGRPPTWSRARTPSRNSNRRGTTSTETPASRQARIASSSCSWLAREKAMMTRSICCSRDHLGEVIEPAQPRQVGAADVVDLVVDHPDRDEAELGVVVEFGDDLAGDDAGAEDQGPLAQVGIAVEAGADDRAGDAGETGDAGDSEEGQHHLVADTQRHGGPEQGPGDEEDGDEAPRDLGDGGGPGGELVAAIEADAEGGEGPEGGRAEDEDEALLGLEAERDDGDAGGAEGRDRVAHVEHPRQHGATLFRAVRRAVPGDAVRLAGRNRRSGP